MRHEGSSFLCGCAPFSDFLFFSKMLDEMAEQGKPSSSFFVMDRDEWMKYEDSVGWPALDMATLKIGEGSRVVVAAGPSGQFWELDDDSTTETVGVIAEDGPAIRALAASDGVIYACGMGRVVYRREGPGEWRSIGPTAPLPAGDTIVGFEHLDAFSPAEMYAVGWHGEIWRYDQKSWVAVESPVKTNLHAVCCAADGQVYVVGANGVLLRGRGDAWSVVPTGRIDDITDVALHEGVLYVATEHGLLKLDGEALVDERDFADPADRPTTGLHLLPAEGGLFYVGPKDLFLRTDGPWKRLV